jgi:oligopeptide transport system ATP-binding protein
MVKASKGPLLQAHDLSVWFPTRRALGAERRWIRAVDRVSLGVMQGETLGIVGESGCGKTTLGRAFVMLHRPTAGSVEFAGHDLTKLRGKALRAARRHLQIFQDPYASLDPRQKVKAIVEEPLLIAGIDAATRSRRVGDLLDLVGLGAEAAQRLPREFSGGQRQRIGIARALAAEPKLVICDEPLSALDVSVQAQIVNLLIQLQRQLGLTYVFISHDLAVVRQIADRIAVMYLGAIAEIAQSEQLFKAPRHPYTVALLSAAPTLSKTESGLTPILLFGDPPSPMRVPAGCCFHSRCWLRECLGRPAVCSTEIPVLSGGENHRAACHFRAETAAHAASFLPRG